MLQHEGKECNGHFECVSVNPRYELNKVNKRVLGIKQRGLRIVTCTWNFQGLCSVRKALEVGEVLSKNHIDIIGGQECWELDTGSSKIHVHGYMLFRKPTCRESIKGKRGEGGVGLLVREYLIDDVTTMKGVKSNASMWLRVRIRSGVDLYIGCSTQGKVKQICTERFNFLEEDMCMFQWKGRVLLLGDFNARVGKGDHVDEVIGMFGENTCNSNGKLLIELLQNCSLMTCNGRTLLADPQWTRVQSRLGHKSIIDYIITDNALMKKSSNVFVDRTDIGSSDHYLVWFELGRNFGKNRNRAKRVLYKWRVDRLQDKTMRNEYQVELGLHSSDFFQTLDDLVQEGVGKVEMVRRMASKWEKVVDRAASVALGRKLIICGRSVKWWDEELRQLVKDDRACFSRFLGNDNKWSTLKYIRNRNRELGKKEGLQ